MQGHKEVSEYPFCTGSFLSNLIQSNQCANTACFGVAYSVPFHYILLPLPTTLCSFSKVLLVFKYCHLSISLYYIFLNISFLPRLFCFFSPFYLYFFYPKKNCTETNFVSHYIICLPFKNFIVQYHICINKLL